MGQFRRAHRVVGARKLLGRLVVWLLLLVAHLLNVERRDAHALLVRRHTSAAGVRRRLETVLAHGRALPGQVWRAAVAATGLGAVPRGDVLVLLHTGSGREGRGVGGGLAELVVKRGGCDGVVR